MTRGEGATTKQMQDAPPGAIFVWCNGSLGYPRSLALHLGRTDLRVEPPSFFEGKWRGIAKPVIVDHAAILSFNVDQVEGLRACRAYLHIRGIQ